jgi:sterol desaturase/sphingolipid hydroxylase (fatty acid hydroxylase superfamily)
MMERIFPWRREQKMIRPEFFQDCFWLLFNGIAAAIVFAKPFEIVNKTLDLGFYWSFAQYPGSIKLISHYPFAVQLLVVVVITDFVEWCVHNSLHRVSWLWKIHRVHHSIVRMDWLGNFRFHWGELFVYKIIKYIPVALLGASWQVMLAGAVVATVIGNLNHANIRVSWGPLRYVVNSPRMHLWHHEKKYRGKAGVNFAIVFSAWDWIFGTAYMPAANEPLQPGALGYTGQEKTSRTLLMRFFLPFVDTKSKEGRLA